MRCSRDSDVVFWIVSDLCVSAKCVCCMVGEGGRRDGMAPWVVGVEFLCGTVGLQTNLFSTRSFLCFFVYFGPLNLSVDED